MLICLTGQDAQNAMRNCQDLLEDPSLIAQYVDKAAEWPVDGEEAELTINFVKIIIGLVSFRSYKKRMPFKRAVEQLEDLAEEAGLQDGMRDADVKGSAERGEEKECMVCMASPRNVRYACGHLACCIDCTKTMMATAQSERPQNMCVVCRAVIVIVGQGDDLAYEKSFIKQDCDRPPTLEMPKFAQRRTYQPGHEIRVTFEPGPIGMFLASRAFDTSRPVDAVGNELVIISRVEAGSQADRLGLPQGAEIIEINGESARGLTRHTVAERAAVRPFSLMARVPGATPAAGGFQIRLPGMGGGNAANNARPAAGAGNSNGQPRRGSSPQRPARRSASPLRRMLGRG